MPFTPHYQEIEPMREEIDSTTGRVLLEFGTQWCGHCQALSPTVEQLLTGRPHIRHVRIADGRGKPLGRSFRVKLWPTFVFLDDGKVLAQLVRPTPDEVRQAFEQLGGERPSA